MGEVALKITFFDSIQRSKNMILTLHAENPSKNDIQVFRDISNPSNTSSCERFLVELSPTCLYILAIVMV